MRLDHEAGDIRDILLCLGEINHVRVRLDREAGDIRDILLCLGEINHVRVRLDREAGVPFFVVLAFLSTGII